MKTFPIPFPLAWIGSRFGLIACACLLAACANPQTGNSLVVQCGDVQPNGRGPALVGQPYGSTMSPIPLNSVQFGSPDLTRMFAVQGLFAERTATNTVVVKARFVSCLDVPASIRVRTSFLRDNLAPAEEPSGWKVVFLSPRATANYQEFSTARDPTSYLIEVAH